MALKGLNEITQNLINNIHDTLPDVDTKEGTFIREVFVDPTSLEISELYDEIRAMQLTQSILTATGEDLDNLASNFFIERKAATRSYGTLRFFIKSPVESDIVIPKGTIVTIPGTATADEKIYETTETRIVTMGYDIYDPIDPTLLFIDIPAGSTFEGLDANADARTINTLQGLINPEIILVENTLPFTGGTDEEEDLSLALRVSLAISGSNIGTKDGYTSFILKQEEVIDGRVVGAGEPLMKRDQGRGGMVDVYVRVNGSDETSYTFEATKEYITNQINQPAYSNIVLPDQPVESVISVVGNAPGGTESKTYVNGSEYDIEGGSNKYYKDTLWDFKYPLDDTTLENKAIIALNDKLEAFFAHTKLGNVDFYLNWNLIVPENDNEQPPNEDFLRGYYTNDNKIYQLKSKIDVMNPYIGNRYFIFRDGLVYERKYISPDFVLIKDNSDYSNSYLSKDSIKWLASSNNKPVEDEVLEIKYSFGRVMRDLQERIDQKRVITADVLIKKAIKVPIEVYAEIVPYEGFDQAIIKDEVINRITTYINNIKKLGGTISLSDIAYVIRGTEGVDDVGLDTLKLATFNGPKQKQIVATEMEYLEVDRVIVVVHPIGTTV